MTGWAHQAGRRNLGTCFKTLAGVFHRTNGIREILCIWSVIQIVLYWGTLLWSGEFFSSHIWHSRGILLQFSGAFQNCDSSPKQGRSQEWPRKPFTSTNLSKTLSLCFTHWGLFLIFTISDHGEGGNKKSVFMRTSLWNVTVFENHLRPQVKLIWILNYLLSGRKKNTLLEYLSRKETNVFQNICIKLTDYINIP